MDVQQLQKMMLKCKNTSVTIALRLPKHPSGLYYQIIEAGTSTTPTINSTVKANYTGKFTNNSSFDGGVASFSLGGVIEGWQIGIPLIKQGGTTLL